MFPLPRGAVRAGAVAAALGFGGWASAQVASAQISADLPAIPIAPIQATSPASDATPSDGVPVPPVSAAECNCASVFDWKKVPRVRPLPRIGNISVLPTGPGYYSVLDQIRGDCLSGPPKYPYPRFGIIQPSFFDVD